jgi:predicted RNA-binding Zn ribbon-like protein
VNHGRPQPFFVAGAAGLDFLNSIATPVDVPVDWIASGEDLLDWLECASLLDRDAAARFRQAALPGELDTVAGQARALREWFRAFVNDHKGRRLDASALGRLEPLNRLLARDESFVQVGLRSEREESGSCFSTHRKSHRGSPDALLLSIAEALADLVCDVEFTDIRQCEGAACSLLYVDPTRAHTRRWCSMAVCGNRWKQAAHRERNKQLREPRVPT